MGRLFVHLACNDERGVFTGEAEAFEFFDADSDHLLSIDSGVAIMVEFSANDDGRWLRVGGREYPCGDRAHYVGNICWDATSMHEEHAASLLRYLFSRGFGPSEWCVESNPLLPIIEEHNERCAAERR